MANTRVSLKSPQLVLGIDPGFDRVGWAVLDTQTQKPLLIDCGCVLTDRKQTHLFRYQQISQFFDDLLDRYTPQLVGIEQLYVARNISTAIPVAQARGVILSCLLRHHITIRECNPSTMKLTVTGNGKADKAAIKKMVLLQIQVSSTEIKEKLMRELDDTIDAVAIALTALTLRTSV